MIKLSEKRKENIAPIPGNILFLSLAAILTFDIQGQTSGTPLFRTGILDIQPGPEPGCQR